jgi:hypothetical protein
MADDDRAVVVGITKYPELGDLDGPENDAREFHGWLIDPDGGAVPDDPNVDLILSSDYPPAADPLDAEPTTQAVERAFAALVGLGMKNAGRAGRRLYIFMAGHGFAPSLEAAALLMANAARGRTGYHISGQPYADWFRQAAFFDEVVLFMDCCRENYPRAPLRPPPFEAMSAAHPARYVYGLATEWSQAARERPWNGTVRGVFSRTLVSGLRSAHDSQGSITGASLEAYVFNAIKADGPDGEQVQEPKFSYDKMHDITFVAGKPKPRYHVHVRLGPGTKGQTVEMQEGQSFQPIPGQKTNESLWEWDLGERGIYKVVLSGGGEKYVEVTGELREIDVEF